MKKVFRKSVAVLLALLMVVSTMSGLAMAADDDNAGGITPLASSGTCGTGVTWLLDDDGTLTISGDGAMSNYSYATSVPWFYSRSSIFKVVVENGVTSVSDNAFYDCWNMTSASIAGSVTSIGSLAFYSWGDLTIVITFAGDAPSFASDSFKGTVITAYYPSNNDTWTESVRQSYSGLEVTWIAYDQVDKTELKAAIAEANALKEEEYTPASWAVFDAALKAAVAVDVDEDASQTEVDDATDALTEAMDALVAVLDKTALEAAIEEANALKEEEYTPASWAVFDAALKAAVAVDEDEDASQTEVDDATDALTEAMEELVEAADKTALEEAIAEADELDEEAYTPDSWAVLEEALKTAETVVQDPNASQDEVNEATRALTDAMTALVEAADKTELNSEISEAESLNKNDYTADSWAALQSALDSAKAVQSDEYATQDAIDAAVKALAQAVDGLKKNSSTGSFTGFASNEGDGNWYYYRNGKIATDVTTVMEGTVKDSNGWWYVVSGKVQLDYSGVCDYSNEYGWWYVDNGKVNFNKNSVEQNRYGWWYVTGGKVQFGYTGVSDHPNAYGWWYVKDGKVDFSKTGIEPNSYGWWRVVGGKVDFSCNSVEQNDYGWWYLVGGKVQFGYTGVADYSNAYGWWYVKGGKVDFSKTGIEPNKYGWWRVVSGKVDFSCNSVEQNSYGWWYLVGGKVDFSYTGVSDYGNAYGYWYIRDGKVDFSVNSVEQNRYGWWYVLGGKVQFGYTGVADYANAYGWWYIRDGKVDFGYTGRASNSYGTWNVVDGKVVF